MSNERTSIFIPRTSLRSPGFIGPVIVATALLAASIFTAPWDDDFSVVKLNDPMFTGFIGIWGACTRFNQDNSTTANPTANLTGNYTFDAIVSRQGKHRVCSGANFGWSFSVPVNSSGLAGIPNPNSTTIGVNVQATSENTPDLIWLQVMSKSQSHLLVTHVIAGISAILGLLLLLIPYKPFQESSPHLAKFLKTASLSLILVALSAIASLVSFVLTLMTAIKVRNNINQIGGGGGAQASLGNIFWFSIAAFCLSTPSLWSTRGPM
ncbi:hypothetical protein MJO28_015485 [Puccinia striiformis f. sp. tritici]|uniref:Uncharacterized protein n=4 Tax=Puccinia striiformis TaxID=27350 RepID=A0A0L0URY7_9BASI|nr:hypothetical protein Pst134EA_029496 [Puccinia striiformis f. sp. tritici]KNE89666.1 hypothetical protein PSTG_16863 [Puccinia striiformis f. sp. tritici PST-78]POW06169.1 hypothetical protein PSHT_10487 [Puccinia striiformis]KAH9441487.1 hypothetical protein Pst134EB_030155 [Puccinia striiformis f. sp. tritici]KAH9447460.1 hypothetical protein Pst134EA_029496 [Puccinia striiformis f. sp. tritici]KAI7936568.1 hypothetical protein MJO29_015871 [Puccinia striiformis f. sp. tritici]